MIDFETTDKSTTENSPIGGQSALSDQSLLTGQQRGRKLMVRLVALGLVILFAVFVFRDPSEKGATNAKADLDLVQPLRQWADKLKSVELPTQLADITQHGTPQNLLSRIEADAKANPDSADFC